MTVRFNNVVLQEACNAYYVACPFHKNKISFYDYLGEFPHKHKDGGYELSDYIYNKMVMLHSPHASTIIKAWIAKNKE